MNARSHSPLRGLFWVAYWVAAVTVAVACARRPLEIARPPIVPPPFEPPSEPGPVIAPYLASFEATTGVNYLGEITLRYNLAADSVPFNELTVWRVRSSVPPSNCAGEAGATQVFSRSAPFSDSTHSDLTQDYSGGYFSYSVCLRAPDGTTHLAHRASNIQSALFTPVTTLVSFSARTGVAFQGDIDLEIGPPLDTRRIRQVVVFRKKGLVPPIERCADGVLVRTLTALSAPLLAFTDTTAEQYGAQYSYRACIVDASGEVSIGNTVTGVTARDTISPDQFFEFLGVPGINAGDIALSLRFPANTMDYQSVTIRYQPGPSVPIDCAAGNAISIAGPYSSYETRAYIHSTGSRVGAIYSYRACAFDGAGNARSLTLAGVPSKFLGNPSCSIMLNQPKVPIGTAFSATLTPLGTFDSAQIEGTFVTGPLWSRSLTASTTPGNYRVSGRVTGPSPLPDGTCDVQYTACRILPPTATFGPSTATILAIQQDCARANGQFVAFRDTIHFDDFSALEICRCQGYSQVQSKSCDEGPPAHRCGFTSPGNNYMTYFIRFTNNWFEYPASDDNRWLSAVTCTNPIVACP